MFWGYISVCGQFAENFPVTGSLCAYFAYSILNICCKYDVITTQHKHIIL